MRRVWTVAVVAGTEGGEVRGIDPQRGVITSGIDVGQGPSDLASHGLRISA